MSDDHQFDGDGWDCPLGAMQMLGRSDPVTMRFGVSGAEDPAALAAHSLDFWLTTGELPLAGNRVTLGADGQITWPARPPTWRPTYACATGAYRS